MRHLTFVLVTLAVVSNACADGGDSDVTVEPPTDPTVHEDSEWRTVELMDFQVVDNNRLEVLLAYCGDNHRVEVDETAEAVTIRAETSDPEQPPAPDCATFATTSLEDPLGSRTVVDAKTGESVRQG